MAQLVRSLPCATLALLLTSSCGVFTGASDADGPAQVQELVSWMERVHVESELAAQGSAEAIEALLVLTSQQFKVDAVTDFAVFVETVDRSEERALALAQVVSPMKAAGAPVFSRWEDDVARMTSPALQDRSRERMEATRAQYESVVAEIDPALESYQILNRGLRDHALFLANDLNRTSLSMIQRDVEDLDKRATSLGFAFGRTAKATRDYIQGSALPSAPVAQPAAPMGNAAR